MKEGELDLRLVVSWCRGSQEGPDTHFARDFMRQLLVFGVRAQCPPDDSSDLVMDQRKMPILCTILGAYFVRSCEGASLTRRELFLAVSRLQRASGAEEAQDTHFIHKFGH